MWYSKKLKSMSFRSLYGDMMSKSFDKMVNYIADGLMYYAVGSMYMFKMGFGGLSAP